MQKHVDIFMKDTEYEEGFRLMAERDRLANHLSTLRRITWDLRAKICQFEGLLGDMTDLKADMKSLQDQINATAQNLGMPLGDRE